MTCLCRRLCAVMMTCMVGLPAFAQYPTKPVRIIAGAPPGGGTDILSRIVAEKLGDSLKQTFIVDNRPGASNTVASEITAKAAPDGYTTVLGNITSHAIAPHLLKLRFDPIRDFTLVALVGSVPNVLVVNNAVAANSVKELVALLKAKPGLQFASSGIGSSQHVAGEAFKALTGVEMLHVPYKGSSQAVVDLIGGQVQLNFDTMPSVIAHIRSGRLRALAVLSENRSAQLSQVPTLAEAGYPGLVMSVWYGLYAPAGTPKGIVMLLNTEVNKLLKLPDVQSRFAAVGAEAIGGTPEQFEAFARAELEKWGKVLRVANIKVE